jgi:hypothetical protein
MTTGHEHKSKQWVNIPQSVYEIEKQIVFMKEILSKIDENPNSVKQR